MRPDVQQAVDRIWPIVTTENASEYCDIEGYWDDFFQMFGFRQPGIDYAADVEIDVRSRAFRSRMRPRGEW
jgi:enoyl-[acyl-carrier protein] reductase/trans-2-enoyl-CoA reductase (NAD+)